ncbi:MAG: MOSC domain-containing protein [Luminiphilus sp.]|nr:MOSC domain-containing protein [Luminiphilus sp.]
MPSVHLRELLRYPVKSMLGEPLSEAVLGEKGILGDRIWAIRDEKRGGIRGGKKLPHLMMFSAATGVGAAPMITAPDGESCAANSDEVHRWLSEKLNHPVTLWPLLPAENLDHYRRGAPDDEDFQQELMTVFGRLPGEPIPDLTLFAEVLEFESPPGTYFDAFPILVMTYQSMATLAKCHPEGQFDFRRFRPNLLIDAVDDTSPFPEQAWIGKQLCIGDVVLEIVGPCPRCSMTTHATGDLPRDTSIMRHLVIEAEGNLGVYAKVVTAGKVKPGQTLQLI